MQASNVEKVARATLNRRTEVIQAHKCVYLLRNVFPDAIFRAMCEEAKDAVSKLRFGELCDVQHFHMTIERANAKQGLERVRRFASALENDSRQVRVRDPVLVHYMGGCEEGMDLHHDEGILMSSDPDGVTGLMRAVSGLLWKKWTLLLYLNDVDPEEGGTTVFPFIDVRISPRTNSAVLFKNGERFNRLYRETCHLARPCQIDKTALNFFIETKSER